DQASHRRLDSPGRARPRLAPDSDILCAGIGLWGSGCSVRAALHGLAERGPRRIVTGTLRPFATMLLRCVVLVADPATVGWWTARVARQPERAAADMAPRGGGFFSPPPPPRRGRTFRRPLPF